MFWGQITTSGGQISILWGQVSMFCGQISIFWGQIIDPWMHLTMTFLSLEVIRTLFNALKDKDVCQIIVQYILQGVVVQWWLFLLSEMCNASRYYKTIRRGRSSLVFLEITKKIDLHTSTNVFICSRMKFERYIGFLHVNFPHVHPGLEHLYQVLLHGYLIIDDNWQQCSIHPLFPDYIFKSIEIYTNWPTMQVH